jgi:uncharacterized phage protein gp47/JayE
MSVSPDFTPYVDLTLYDKDATDIVEAAQATLQARIPDWVPSSTNIEVMLLEAMAIEVAETIFSVNRLPVTMIRALLALYGVEQDPGAPPTVTLTFTAVDTDGYAIPAGTEVALLTSSNTYISFFTDAEAVIGQGSSTQNVAATATEYTNIANGTPIGTSCELIDAITGIDAVETATIVSGGTLPESVDAWTERGVQRLQRLVDTLVIPEHFTSAALEDTNVYRANTIDNYDPGTGPNPGDNPGHVTVVVYGDGAALTTPQKNALLADLEVRCNANLVVHVIDPTVTTQAVTASIKVKTGYVSGTVIAAVQARLNEYLSPTTWPWAGTIRRNELISVIDQVEGVDYVSAITVPAADVTLTAGSTLADAGTLTITAI